jgi:hypothetical protein
MSELFDLAKKLTAHQNFGPLTDGHYVQLGIGMGFYVPEADYQIAQRRANETLKVQFLSVDSLGRALHGTREELLGNPECKAGIAWIVPQGRDIF